MTSKTIYHYVYRITNIVEKKYYYGKRSSKIEPKEDLGKKYFSSSKDRIFITDQKLNPQNYLYKIVAVFSSNEEALSREIKLHTTFDVGINPKFYNKSIQTATGFSMYGTKASQETREKLSTFQRNRCRRPRSRFKHTNESKLKISSSLSGRKRSEETRRKISLAKRGVPHSGVHKENHRKAVSGANSNTAKKITIHNAEGIIIYTCFGNFQKTCEENNLPFSALRFSLQNSSKPIFTLKNSAGMPVKRAMRWENFIGWYVK